MLLKILREKKQPLIWIPLLIGFIGIILLRGRLTAGRLIAPESLCFAETSLYVSPEKQPWGNNDRWGTRPVMLGNRLYLYTSVRNRDTQPTIIQEQQFKLWRGDPKGTDDPNQSFSAVKLGVINDPNATALGVYKGYLYLATNKENAPHVWRGEDPNQGEWTLVTPAGIGSGAIMRMCSFDGHLYLGVMNRQESGGSMGSVQLWRSTEAASSSGQEITSDRWEQIEGGPYSALISSDFQEFGGKLYLGVENAQDKAEVWSLESGYKNRFIAGNFGSTPPQNRSMAAMSVSDRMLYAFTCNESGAQVWSLTAEGTNFSRVSSWDRFSDPNRSKPLSIVSPGSYLFLGFNNTGTGREVFRAYHDPNHLWPQQKEKQWGLITIHDRSKDQQTIMAIMDKSNRLRWLYADQDNGYLYLGCEDPNQRATLWRSTRLPLITITSTRDDIFFQTDKTCPYAYVGAFNSKAKVKVNWKSTRIGDYTLRLIQLKDPNGTISQDPNFLLPKQNVVEASKEYGTSLPAQKQGAYISEIAWDAAQSFLDEDHERYPVLFSFIYDTALAETIPAVTSVASGNRKLKVKWTPAHDKLSGVFKYRVWREEVSAETDANTITFSISNSVQCQGNEYTITGLKNGQRYAVAVTAIDAAGNEPAQPDGVSKSFGTPELGRGLTDLVGETGGCFLKTVWRSQIMFQKRVER